MLGIRLNLSTSEPPYILKGPVEMYQSVLITYLFDVVSLKSPESLNQHGFIFQCYFRCLQKLFEKTDRERRSLEPVDGGTNALKADIISKIVTIFDVFILLPLSIRNYILFLRTNT